MTKNLGYYIDFVDEAAAWFKRIESSFERSSPVGKMLSKSIVCYREISIERVTQYIKLHNCFISFRNCHGTPSTFSNHQPDHSAAINFEARPSTSKMIIIH